MRSIASSTQSIAIIGIATLLGVSTGQHLKAELRWSTFGVAHDSENAGPLIVAEFPGGRIPPAYPKVTVRSSGPPPRTVEWKVADSSRLTLNRSEPWLTGIDHGTSIERVV
jgi:hypothetical protein